MLKNSAVNAKVIRTVGTKKIETQTKTIKPSKHEEKPSGTSSGTKSKTVSVTKKNPIARESTSTVTAKSTSTVTAKSTSTVTAKPKVVQSKTILTKTKQITTTAPPIRPKVSNVATDKVIRKPMKALHQLQAKKPVAEKNVMNTIHNVTVTSPPPVRKELVSSTAIIETIPRERTKTRILEPDEVLILNKSKTDAVGSNTFVASSEEKEQNPIVIKEAIAFEVSFEKSFTSQLTNVDSKSKQSPDTTDGDYEDDFDSYESDFESGSSISSHSASTTSSNSSHSSNNSETPTDSGSRSESQSVNVPEKKADEDREFDSGTYELKGVADKLQLDSIDEREPHSEEQNDSGFGYSNSTPSPVEPISSAASNLYSKPQLKSTFSTRGMELMKKINLDTMTFTLFELKPISYELYMKIYGQKNTNQSSSQTIDNMIDQDVQTDKKTTQIMWTQFPPSFITNENLINHSYRQDRLECGEDIEDVDEVETSDKCILENALKRINKINVARNISTTKPIDYERLNYFLQKSAVTMSGLLAENNFTKRELQNSDFSLSDGCFKIPLETSRILDDTVVYYVYSNSKIKNFLYLVHRQKLITASTFVNNFFVSVWSVVDMKKPIHILSCWSLINCLEVHHNYQDVVIGGLSDGSLAVWNLSESTFWHQSIENETLLVPTQIVSPSTETKSIAFDFGSIVSLKALYSFNKAHDDDSNLIQICSLHEFGMLTIWTILKTSSQFINLETSIFNSEGKLDHRSPWSKIQLIQSNVIDLRSICLTKNIRPKSGFEKKKMYFESNLFNDAALRELHDFDLQKELLDQSEILRCIDMEYYEDGIVVATNKSFLVSIATSLSKDSLKKLFIDEGNFISATKLKSMWDFLFVGLSDGTVKVLRIRHSNVSHKVNNRDSLTRSIAHEEENNFSAKSCAIQNIVKEGRQFYDEGDGLSKDRFTKVENEFDVEMTTYARYCEFINNQVLLPAMSANRDFVRWLDISTNLNCLIGLCGEHLRVLNFENFVEVRDGFIHNAIKIATIVCGYNGREYLVNLEDDTVNEIDVGVSKFTQDKLKKIDFQQAMQYALQNQELGTTVFGKLILIDAEYYSEQNIVLQHVSKMYRFFI